MFLCLFFKDNQRSGGCECNGATNNKANDGIYGYGDYHKYVKGTSSVTITFLPEGIKTCTQITAYNYNAAGNLTQ